ncbi:MAG: carbohydrate binding family 9 domain-containing protein [Myxococcales bacterium]|nr:carbohydrate binding family 9 domain-containing protein [Myxococcales bacterium]
MSFPTLRTGLALIAALALTGPALAQDAPEGPETPLLKRLAAHPRGDAPITVDGRLDEPVWAEAQVGTGFVERVPFPGRIPAEVGARTEIRTLYDDRALYVGVTSFLVDGEVPRALELTRDSFNVFSDDAISLKIDVRLDQRTTVGFVTTPAGTQVDYVAVENGGDFRREFDAIWEVATATAADRWVAEFRIPWIALSLPAGKGVRKLGFQVTRDHNARLSTYDWAPMPPQFGAVSALYYGHLEGLEGVAGGTPLTLIPYVLTGYDGPADDLQLKAGGDLRVRFGDDTWSELTLFTDFAQVDLDDPVVNLNRFALFFPERRPFFLSGLEVFEFGASGLSQIFFTRRIGLDPRGRQVPLLGGLKVYGSQGNLRFGLLQALNDGTDEAASDTFTVARARYNFGELGHLGAMATLNSNVPFLTDDAVEDGGGWAPNYSLGADGALRLLDRKLQISGFYSGSINSEGDGTMGHSGRAEVKFLGLEVSPAASVAFISEEFDPKIGFVARRDLLQSRVNLYYILRTQALGLRSVEVSSYGQMEHAFSDRRYLGQRANAYLGATWDSGVAAYVNTAVVEDVVQEDFYLSAAERTVTAGAYRGAELSAGVDSPGGRNPVGSFGYLYSSALFGGRLHQFAASGKVSFGAKMRLELGTQVNLLDYEDQPLKTAVTFNGKLVLTPDTKIALDVIGQANSTADQATVLVRLRWRYVPGSDLFFVYREFLSFGDEKSSDRTLAFKMTYRFDLLL